MTWGLMLEQRAQLSDGVFDFTLDCFFQHDPCAAVQAIMMHGMADPSSLPWVDNTLQRWRTKHVLRDLSKR